MSDLPKPERPEESFVIASHVAPAQPVEHAQTDPAPPLADHVAVAVSVSLS